MIAKIISYGNFTTYRVLNIGSGEDNVRICVTVEDALAEMFRQSKANRRM
jgi:hypothetical protein